MTGVIVEAGVEVEEQETIIKKISNIIKTVGMEIMIKKKIKMTQILKIQPEIKVRIETKLKFSFFILSVIVKFKLI